MCTSWYFLSDSYCILLYYFLLYTYPGGGVSSYAGERGGAGRSLEPCLDQALKDIPKSRHHLTPLYLGATAGMRLLK